MKYLYKKEMYLYFSTPFGFVFLGIFLLLCGVIFTVYNLAGGNGDLAGTFDLLKSTSSMIFPVLTMRCFAEERRTGAEQFLTTSKLSCADIVIAKFLAALTVFVIGLAFTLIYVVIIRTHGEANYGALAASYLGFFLLGSTMIAVCLLCSSFADNQITAAVASFGILFFLIILASLSKTLASVPVVGSIISALAITARYDAFTLGVLSPGPVVYYMAFSAVCVFLTVKNLERRRFI